MRPAPSAQAVTRGRRTRALVVGALSASFALVACGSSVAIEDGPSTTTTTAPLDLGVTNAVVSGLSGLRPGATLNESFRERVAAAEPELRDLFGAAEAYDAVMMVAIATEQSRSDAPGRIAATLQSVSRQGKVCSTFDACRSLATTNTDLDYEGQSGGIQLLDNGDPGEARFELVRFGDDGLLTAEDEIVAEAQPLSTPPAPADPTTGPRADGVLRIATLLPIDGPLPSVARAAQTGVRLAVEDINNKGGVLGVELELVGDESGDGSPDATKAAVARYPTLGVDAVIGGTAFAIDSVALGPLVDAGIPLISPADRNRGLSAVPDRGLFFRTVTSEDVEGRLLAELPVNEGYSNVAVITASTGTEFELSVDVTAQLGSLGAQIIATPFLDPGVDAATVVQQALDAGANAIVIVLPPATTAEVLGAMARLGVAPNQFPTYATAGSMTSELVKLTGERRS